VDGISADETSLTVVTLEMDVPYTSDNFTSDVQIALQYSIAMTLNVSYRFVSIKFSFRTSRRVAGTTVTAEANLPSTSSVANNPAASLASLSTNMKNYGLQPPIGEPTVTKRVATITALVRLNDKLTDDVIKKSLSDALGVPVEIRNRLSKPDGKAHVNVRVPIAKSDFPARQDSFKRALSSAAGVDTSQVSVDSVADTPTGRRAASSVDIDTSIDPSAPTTPPPRGDSSPEVNTGAIAGGVVGGVGGLAVLGVAAYMLYRQPRKKDTGDGATFSAEPSAFVFPVENPSQVNGPAKQLVLTPDTVGNLGFPLPYESYDHHHHSVWYSFNNQQGAVNAQLWPKPA
jgi:hypothetical protein